MTKTSQKKCICLCYQFQLWLVSFVWLVFISLSFVWAKSVVLQVGGVVPLWLILKSMGLKNQKEWEGVKILNH